MGGSLRAGTSAIARVDMRWWVAGIMLVGAALRIRHYLGNRSFWLDELFLALNLQSRSFAELAGPLDWDQMAPLGFLWIERAALAAFGDSELALRFPPLLASLATLALSYPVARLILDRPGSALAATLCALLPGSVYFAAELKQYAFDEFACVALVGLAAACAQRRAQGPLVALAVAGVVMPWLSHPSAFVLAGAGSGLFLKAWIERDRRSALVIVLASTAWLASFALHLVQSGAIGSETAAGMRQFWAALFMPSPLHPKAWMEWMLVWGTKAFGFVQPYGLHQSMDVSLLALFLAALGVAALARHPWLIALLLGPVVAALLASALHLYPFASRFLFFFSPALGILVAAGVMALTRLPHHGRAVALVAAGLVLGVQVPDTLRQSLRAPPFSHEETRPLWQAVRQEFRPGDALYVSSKAIPSMRYYASDLAAAAGPLIEGTPAGGDLRFLDDASRIARHRRTWLLFSHLRPDVVGGREDLLLLEALGNPARLMDVRLPDAAVYRIELSDVRDESP